MRGMLGRGIYPIGHARLESPKLSKMQVKSAPASGLTHSLLRVYVVQCSEYKK